jgi:hypothetical protein
LNIIPKNICDLSLDSIRRKKDETNKIFVLNIDLNKETKN